MILGQNVRIEAGKVISYATEVATIDHENNRVLRLGYWSATTSKHINMAAAALGYSVEDRLLVYLTAGHFVICNTLREASEAVREYIKTSGVGARRWTGGAIKHPIKGHIAQVTFNGRVMLKGLHAKKHLTTYVDNVPFGVEAKNLDLTTNQL
jgi:hypothetical protein